MLTKPRIQKIIFVFMFMWILCCSCTNNQVLHDKAIVSSSFIDDSQTDIYLINKGIIYSINKNSLVVKRTDLEAWQLYVFDNTLYYSYDRQIYKDTTALFYRNEPLADFIVTDAIIWLNTEIMGVFYYALAEETFTRSDPSEFPIADATESAVYIMNVEERTKTEDGHVPCVHVLDMNGTKTEILTEYDGYNRFNDKFYLYKTDMFYTYSHQIYHIDLKSNTKRMIGDLGDEIISVAHDRLYYRSGSNLKILTISDGQITEYADVFDDDNVIYVDSYVNVVYKINHLNFTVEKINT
jgi:hypothetical protein